MKRLEECGAYERQFADIGGKGPGRLFDEIWRENDFDWQWEIDKGSEAFADSGMQRGTYCFQRTIVGYVVRE